MYRKTAGQKKVKQRSKFSQLKVYLRKFLIAKSKFQPFFLTGIRNCRPLVTAVYYTPALIISIAIKKK
jgi:hypothetical protein